MKGDLDTTVHEEELDAKGKPLIDWVKPVEWLLPNAEAYEEWEEDEVDKDVEIIDLYDSEDENGNGSEDSDEVYGEEELDMETDDSEGEYDDDEEDEYDDEEDEGEDEKDGSEGEEEGEYSGALIKPEDEDVDMTGMEESNPLNLAGRGAPIGQASRSSELYSEDASQRRFRASTQEIGERFLGRAMTPKDFFASPEDQQDSIEDIVNRRRRYLAGNARLILDLEAAAREDAEEQGIDLKEMDRIDRELDRLALLNAANQKVPRRVKQEPKS